MRPRARRGSRSRSWAATGCRRGSAPPASFAARQCSHGVPISEGPMVRCRELGWCLMTSRSSPSATAGISVLVENASFRVEALRVRPGAVRDRHRQGAHAAASWRIPSVARRSRASSGLVACAHACRAAALHYLRGKSTSGPSTTDALVNPAGDGSRRGRLVVAVTGSRPWGAGGVVAGECDRRQLLLRLTFLTEATCWRIVLDDGKRMTSRARRATGTWSHSSKTLNWCRLRIWT